MERPVYQLTWLYNELYNDVHDDADSWSVFSVTVAINGKETVIGFGPAQLCFLFKLSR